MDTITDKICIFLFEKIWGVIAIVVIFALLGFAKAVIIANSDNVDKLQDAKEYINLLESDLGEDYILDVASGTDAYQNYYNN